VFHLVSFWLVLGEPNIYHDSGVFYKNWVFYLEGSEFRLDYWGVKK